MESFRKMVRGWLGYTILGVIVLVLAATGIEAYFSGGKLAAATVNGEDILQADLDRMVERQRQQMIAQMGPNVDPSVLDVARVRESVLENLIARELLAQQAEDRGFLVSDATVHKLIREEPAFQENGKFSQQRYEQALQQIGEHPATYPARARQEIAYSMLVGGLGQSGVVTLPELERLSALTNQRRDIHYAVLPLARYLSQVSATDAEIKDFYAAHAERYAQPESVSLEYITLKREDFLAEAVPTEQELRARYEEKVKASGSDERRQAQHILITVDNTTKDADALRKTQDVEKRARAGEDFGKLAKEFSQDPGSVASGGDLGMVGRGMFVPEFEKALFSLKQGEISAPVKTQFGYHLIKLNKIETTAAPSFAALKPELEREVREAKAEELFAEAVDKLDAAVYESSDLKEPAEKFKRSVQMTAPFTRSGGTGLAADRKVVETAFSDELVKEGKNSQRLSLADGSAVWVRVKEYKPATLQPLAEVMADARNQLLLQKAGDKARAAADAIKAALAKGSSLADVAAQEKLSWQSVPDATTRTPLPLPEMQRVAFRLPHPAAGKISADSFDSGSAQVIVAVSKVTPGQPSAEAELAQIRNALSENRSQQEFLDYVRFLRETGKVELRK
jgi:peptidyl-prolyl cis-trans isomerase D